jgi:8-oxo-dGTP pyrophosphatase MutT (NUDIX family)
MGCGWVGIGRSVVDRSGQTYVSALTPCLSAIKYWITQTRSESIVMGKKAKIRPISICLLRRGEDILVHESYDSVKQRGFARPLGGGIDFGETSAQATIREIKEELGADITGVELLGIVENIFIYEGEPGHEIVFVYDGRFVDESLYDRESLAVVEGKRRFEAVWRSPSILRDGPHSLVPAAIWNFL